WVSTPSFAELCLADRRFTIAELPTLHTFLFCGEPLTNECAARLLRAFPGARVFNTYGPTETTVCVTWVRITERMVDFEIPLPLGKVKPDCAMLVVDEHGREVAEGEHGELVICGASVGAGYLGDELRTRRAFYLAIVDGRWLPAYRT